MNVESITLSDSCIVSSPPGSNLCADGPSGVSLSTPSTGRRYSKLQASCLPIGVYHVDVVFFNPDTQAGDIPYTITIGSDSPCAVQNCNNNGLCFQGNCNCEQPFTGSSCSVVNSNAMALPFSGVIPQGISYFYLNLSRSFVGTNNVAITATAAPGNGTQISVKFLMSKGTIPTSSNTVWNEQTSGSGTLHFYHELCSSGATGLFILEVTNDPSFQSTASVTISYSLVQRTLSLPSSSSASLPQADAPGNIAVYYRLASPVNSNLVAAATGDQNLAGLVLVDQDNCLFVEVRSVPSESDLSTLPGSGAYRVQFESCFPDNSNKEYYVAVMGENQASYTLNVSNSGTCPPPGCANGICGTDGQCHCYPGHTGTYCNDLPYTQILLNQTICGSINQGQTLTYSVQVNDPETTLYFSESSTDSTITISRTPGGSPVFGGDMLICANDQQENGGTFYITVQNDNNNDNFCFTLESIILTISPNTPVSDYLSEAGDNFQSNVKIYSFELAAGDMATLILDYNSGTYDNNCVQFEVTNQGCAPGNPQFGVTTNSDSESEVDIPGCMPDTYYVIIYANCLFDPTFPYTLTLETSPDPNICPNCCSNLGTCSTDQNDNPVCQCPPGYTGSDCSEPVCQSYENSFCGIQGSFTFNPTIAQQIENLDCSLQTIVDNLELFIQQQVGSSNDSCSQALAQAYCKTFFLPCQGTQIETYCLSDCLNTLQPCDCGSDNTGLGICSGLETSYGTSYPDLPFTACPASTTGFPTIITTEALTTHEMTTSPLTTHALTTHALTTHALTTHTLTTGASRLTTGRTGSTTGASVQSICSGYSFPGLQGYFCTPSGSGFYQCLSGPFASQSSQFQCPAGTSCHCSVGVECSDNGQQSPCT
jgi:hypothetical protein